MITVDVYIVQNVQCPRHSNNVFLLAALAGNMLLTRATNLLNGWGLNKNVIFFLLAALAGNWLLTRATQSCPHKQLGTF
jgi:hypothetical protein